MVSFPYTGLFLKLPVIPHKFPLTTLLFEIPFINTIYKHCIIFFGFIVLYAYMHWLMYVCGHLCICVDTFACVKGNAHASI